MRVVAAPPPPARTALTHALPCATVLGGFSQRLPDVVERASVWFCLWGKLMIDSTEGTFLLTRRHCLTLPADHLPVLKPGRPALGLVVTFSSALLQERRGDAGGGGLQAVFALRSRLDRLLARSVLAFVREVDCHDEEWRRFQAISLVYGALAGQQQIEGWLRRAPGRTQAHRRLALQRLLRARNRILNAPFEEHAMDSLAAAARYSKSHFVKTFREVFDETPGGLHAAARLEMAKDLVVQSGLSIGEIAADLGYGSRCAFSRMFKTQVGTNASDFRRDRGAVAASSKAC